MDEKMDSHQKMKLPFKSRILGTDEVERVTKAEPGRPRLVTWSMYVSVAWVGVALFMFLISVFGRNVSYHIEGQPMSREVFREYVIHHMLPVFIPACLGLLLIAYGFWKEKAWSRHLVLAYWLLNVIFLSLSPVSIGVFDLLFSFIVPFGVTVWYFYFKENVVEYYRHIAKGP